MHESAQHVVGFDYQGLAILIGACGAFLTTVGTIVIQVISLIRQNRQLALSLSNSEKLEEVHHNVNGNTSRLLDIIEKKKGEEDAPRP